jgi:hypothetical protein
MPENETATPAAEAPQEVAKDSDELSMDDLEAVAGGRIRATDKDGLDRR